MTIDAQLAVGVHPLDNRVPNDGSYQNEAAANPSPLPTFLQTQPEPYSVANYEALPMFERSSKQWQCGQFAIAVNTSGSSVVQVLNRQKGRKYALLYVPKTATAGVLVSSSASDASAGVGIPLAAGDPPIQIYTEGGVWAQELTSGSASTLAYAVFYNPIIDD